ncbi:MAG: hypothetical protein OXG05_15445 [Gammaproteobacteria bacterium]|nr:hypothetical protein [Gammaproteobacteria bacterium]
MTSEFALISCVVLVAQGDLAEPTPMNLAQLQQAFSWDFDAPIDVQTVADGLQVSFGIGGNIAVLIGKSVVLVVDDQFSELIAKVNHAIAELRGGAVNLAINAHRHFDHAGGNKELSPAGTWIVCNVHAVEMMPKNNIINLVIAM